MVFNDRFFSFESKLSVGIEGKSGKYYLSIPVRNPYVQYEEYYQISKVEFDLFCSDIEAAKLFAERCRKRLEDSRLILKPGEFRGDPL